MATGRCRFRTFSRLDQRAFAFVLPRAFRQELQRVKVLAGPVSDDRLFRASVIYLVGFCCRSSSVKILGVAPD